MRPLCSLCVPFVPSPENYTHGTSAQRVKWFRLGLQTGDLRMLKEIFELPYDKL